MKRRSLLPFSRKISLALLGLISCALVALPDRLEAREPTELEQFFLELINRARANPGAAVTRLSGMPWGGTPDLNEGPPSPMITNTPKPPLAFQSNLIDAASDYADLLQINEKLQHDFGPVPEPDDRMVAAGLPVHEAVLLGGESRHEFRQPHQSAQCGGSRKPSQQSVYRCRNRRTRSPGESDEREFSGSRDCHSHGSRYAIESARIRRSAHGSEIRHLHGTHFRHRRRLQRRRRQQLLHAQRRRGARRPHGRSLRRRQQGGDGHDLRQRRIQHQHGRNDGQDVRTQDHQRHGWRIHPELPVERHRERPGSRPAIPSGPLPIRIPIRIPIRTGIRLPGSTIRRCEPRCRPRSPS